MKKYIAIVILPLLLFVGACGNNSSNNDHSSTTKVVNTVNFNGRWAMAKKIDGIDFVAQISDNHVVINLVDKSDDDFTALYWVGTFPITDPNTIVSQGDVEKMSNAMLASEDKTKTFSYKDGLLSYKFSSMGTTRTIKLKQTSN